MVNVSARPEFMTQRERLMTDRLKFLMRVHALNYSARVLFNTPEIDETGYDINIEHRFSYLPLQLKTKGTHAKTSSWKIQAGLFQPKLAMQNEFDLKVHGHLCGLEGGGGGVLLQVFDDTAPFSEGMEINYYYSDYFYVFAVFKGYWKVQGFSAQQAEKILVKIMNLDVNEKFNLPMAAFFPIKSPASVLELLLHIGQMSNYVSVHNHMRGSSVPALLLRPFWKSISAQIPLEFSSQFPNYIP